MWAHKMPALSFSYWVSCRLVAWLGQPGSKPTTKTGVERTGHHHSVIAPVGQISLCSLKLPTTYEAWERHLAFEVQAARFMVLPGWACMKCTCVRVYSCIIYVNRWDLMKNLSISFRNLAPSQSSMSLYALSALFFRSWITAVAMTLIRSILMWVAVSVDKSQRHNTLKRSTLQKN